VLLEVALRATGARPLNLGAPLEGRVLCVARRVHGGRSTQVWDEEVTHSMSGNAAALFRCTQMLLFARS
jgi:acyl-coenzyme A thioesterase PaaI-like protein